MIITSPSYAFTRPANTTPYSSGNLVANSTTAGSVVPLSWVLGQSNINYPFTIKRVIIQKSGTSVTNFNFNLHLFTAAPLEVLLRGGTVVSSGESHFRAASRTFIFPDGMSPDRIEDFGAALARFAHTLEHNFNPANLDSKRLERFVAADKGLPPELVPAFEAHVRARADLYLADLDSWLARYSEIDADERGARVQAGVNVFFYVEPPYEEEPLSGLVQASRIRGSRRR